MNFLPEILLWVQQRAQNLDCFPKVFFMRCLKCVRWTWHFRGGKLSQLGHMISYMVLKTLGYISCYIIIGYYFAVLTGISVYSNLKIDSLKVYANHCLGNGISDWKCKYNISDNVWLCYDFFFLWNVSPFFPT